MPRTTLNIDEPILEDLRRLQKAEKKSLGRVVSDLLAWAIRAREARETEPVPFAWTAKPMQARVNLADKEAVWAVLDREEPSSS